MRKAMSILWPSFLVAAAATGAFFSAFDPWQLRLFDWAVYFSRTAVYSLGFIAFWALAAASSTLTWLLLRPREEVNRCPLPAVDRPPGCPIRALPGTQCQQ